jgi:hypothetical protein
MYLQIKKIKKTKWNFDKWNNLEISMIGLYQDGWEFIKWVKLNEAIQEVLLNSKIKYENNKTI